MEFTDPEVLKRAFWQSYDGQWSPVRVLRSYVNYRISGPSDVEELATGSRAEPWLDRPQAAALLAAMARPDRGVDAIVVGEYERAFAAGQFDEMAALFERHGVQVWLHGRALAPYWPPASVLVRPFWRHDDQDDVTPV